jgi:uncharacterized protein (DUF983 family)
VELIEKEVRGKKVNRCKACGSKIEDRKKSYLIDRQGNRICKKCGDAVMKKENAKGPDLVKIIEVGNGEKAIILTR